MLTAFSDPVFDSQRNFRELLQAMARPAVARAIPTLPSAPAPLTPATMAILLTLCDVATSVWLQQPNAEILQHLRFHAGTRLVDDPREADFAVITEAASMPRLDSFAQGQMRYPDRSASLIVQVADMHVGAGPHFAGPGIRQTAQLSIDGLPPSFWPQRAAMASRLPLGLDFFFVDARRVVALPRTTRLLEG